MGIQLVFDSTTRFTFQPTLAAIDFIRNFKRLKRLLPKTLAIRLITLTFITILVLGLRLRHQNYEAPKFRWEDNPIAFANAMTKVLSQNYLYALNFFLLVTPEWLCFDWSFESIKLINNFNDLRVIFIVIFYVFLMSAIYSGVRQR